jgi:hypothetical protein
MTIIRQKQTIVVHRSEVYQFLAEHLSEKLGKKVKVIGIDFAFDDKLGVQVLELKIEESI